MPKRDLHFFAFLLLCNFLLVGRSVYCAEVIRVGSNLKVIAISQEITRQWKANDRVCVLQEQTEIDCGVVVKSKGQFAIVKLKEGNDTIARGDKVIRDTKIRKPAALMQQEVAPIAVVNDKSYFHNLSGGFSVGTGFYYPLLHFQRIVDPQFAIGIQPSYINISAGNGSINSLSVMLTGNYYANEFFKGLWIQAGGGMAFMSSTVALVEEQATSLVFLSTVGWRAKTDLGVNVGIAGGVQYIRDPGFATAKLNGVGIQPLVILDIGFSF